MEHCRTDADECGCPILCVSGLVRQIGSETYGAVLSAAAVIAGSGLCTLASHILIPILYSADCAASAPYFLAGNLAQVLYFISNVLTVVLLRFTKARNQVYINAVYSISFLLLCVPGTLFGGFSGFCTALLVTCAIRFVYTLGLGYYNIWRKKILK